MTRQELWDGMHSIQAGTEEREKVWNQLCERQSRVEARFGAKSHVHRNTGRKSVSQWKMRTSIVAALLLCMILVQGIAHADEIVNYFRGHLSQSPNLKNDVNQSVFEDRDEHILMEVCELLSDGSASCMTVKYTALDQKGRKWLFGETLQDAPLLYRKDRKNLCDVLGIVPIEAESGEEMSGTASFGTREIAEEQTQTSRVFSLEYDVDEISSKRCILTYPLSGESRQKTLTLQNLLKTYTYALSGNCSSTSYTPRYLRISKLKYVVYGENHGIYRKTYHDTGVVSERISDEDIDSAVLYFKKHSSLDLLTNDPDYSSMGEITPTEVTCNMDLRVLSGAFYGEAEWIPFEDTKHWYDDDAVLEERIDHRLTVAPEDVEQIEINGDLFTLSFVRATA